jgi:Tfp pilus assembly protein PilF
MLTTRNRIILALHVAACMLSGLAVAHAGEPADDALATAISMDGAGQLADARYYYGKALLHRPDDKDALLRLGLVQVRLGEAESAHVVLGRLQRMCAGCTETLALQREVEAKLARAP